MAEFHLIYSTLWFLVLIGFIVSLITTLIIVQTSHLHARFTANSLNGPQKIHQHATPRIGGVVMFVSMVVVGFLGLFEAYPISVVMLYAIVPVFFGGLLEDLTGLASPRIRLLLAIISGVCFVWLSDFYITRVGLAPIDILLQIPVICVVLTIFSITLFTNAVNIIDGLNGLSIGTIVLTASVIATVAGGVGDTQLMAISMIFAASILGVGLFNFPKGKIFVGDGGAYFMGAYIAFLLIMLPERNETVSPFVSLLLVFYPSYELLRSTIRRLIANDARVLHPDQKHLHSLVYIYYIYRGKAGPLNPNAQAGLTMLFFPVFTSLWTFLSVSSFEYALLGILIFLVCYELINYRLLEVTKEVSDKTAT